MVAVGLMPDATYQPPSAPSLQTNGQFLLSPLIPSFIVMSDPVALADPDLLLSAPLPSHHSSDPASSSSKHDRALDDITDSFNLDYLTLQHNAEIENIRAQKSGPRVSSAPHRRRHPLSSSVAVKSSSERSLLEERCAMLERLLHKQSSEMEEYVNSTAQLYVKLSDQQGKLQEERRRREEREKDGDEWRSKAEQLQLEYERVRTERERERDSNARLITALKREASDVRAKWVELEARHRELTEQYEAHQRRYTQRLDELERQRQQWDRHKAEAEEMRDKAGQLKSENERLQQDAVRVGQLTAELNGMQEIVDRLRAERVSFEVDRGAWAEERKEREKEIRGLVERLMKEELEVERAKLDAATLRQQLHDTSGTHTADRAAMQQRLEQQRTEHNQRIKQLNEQLADSQLQLRLLKEENERLIHPDHHENQALKQQLIAAMQQQAALTQQLHHEEIKRVERDGLDRDRDRQLTALLAHRKRLIGRVWREKQKLEVQRWFYRWSGWIGERRKRREEEREQGKKKEEEGRREQEERKREKEGVDAALRELEDKMKRLEVGRHNDEEKQKMREEVEEEARRKRRRQAEEEEEERRRREAKNREKEERKEVESSDDEKGPSRHRHRHTHYLSPTLSPSLSPHPTVPTVSLSGDGSQSYGPLLSALLSMRGAVSGGAPADDELIARMETLLGKMNRLQRMQRETEATRQPTAEPMLRPSSASATWTEETSDSAAAAVAGTELPIALLAPPIDAALLPPPLLPQTAHSTAKDRSETNRDKRAGHMSRAATTPHRSVSTKARPHSSPAVRIQPHRPLTKQSHTPAAAAQSRASKPLVVNQRAAGGMSEFIEHVVSQQRTSSSSVGNKRWGNVGRALSVAATSK